MSAEMGDVSSIGGFFSRLRKKRIPEILAGFVGGGWLILEFVHWILIDHYHFPENTLDIAFITLLCALSSTLTWRVFGGAEKRQRKFKIEFVLIPVLILVTAFFDIRLVRQAARLEKPSLGDAGRTPPGNAGLKINPKRVSSRPLRTRPATRRSTSSGASPPTGSPRASRGSASSRYRRKARRPLPANRIKANQDPDRARSI